MKYNKNKLKQLKNALQKFPKVSLAQLPTVLQLMPRLSDYLTSKKNKTNLYIKRDDCTGLAFGGNKARMLEYCLGDLLDKNYDCIVGGAGYQSNYCRQLAAACSQLGIECHVLIRKTQFDVCHTTGNFLLMKLLGANIHILSEEEHEGHHVSSTQHDALNAKTEELKKEGKNPFCLRIGNETNLEIWSLGYVQAGIEILEQAEDLNLSQVWTCTADTTHAGLELAFQYCEADLQFISVSPFHKPVSEYWGESHNVTKKNIADKCAKYLNLDFKVDVEKIITLENYVGEGYGIMTPECKEAMQILAQKEGLLLDPIYSGKAFAGLIDYLRTNGQGTNELKTILPPISNSSTQNENDIIFIHTGGLPNLFVKPEDFLD